jgi:hypothetical protein
MELGWQSIDAHVTRVAAAFDPSRVSVADAAEVVSQIGVIEAKLYAVKARAAARAAEAGPTMPTGPRGRGRGPARTAAEALATRSGTTINEADRLVRTGQRLEEQPDLLGAAQSGELSPTQVELISDAGHEAPDEINSLVERAKATSISGLKDACAAAKAAVDPDPEASQRRAHAARKLRLWAREQVGKFFGEGTALQNAWLTAALEPVRDELRLEARRRGERLTEDQLSYDALMLLVSRGMGIDLPFLPDPVQGDDDCDDTGGRNPGGGHGPGRGPRGGAPRDTRPKTARPSSATTAPFPDPRPTATATTATGVRAPGAASTPVDPSMWIWSTKDYGHAGDSPAATPWSSDRGDETVVRPDTHLWVARDCFSAGDTDAATPWTSARRTTSSGEAFGESHDDVPVPDEHQPDSGGSGIRGPSRKTAQRKWSKATTIIRIDASAAARGRPVAGEICELAGTGPIPVSGVESVLAQGSRLAIVSTRDDGSVESVAHVRRDRIPGLDIRNPEALAEELARSGKRVDDFVHEGRRPTSHQITALQWISPTCTVDGCSNANCEMDHETGYAVTRNTRLGDLDPLCRYHHRMKTLHGWALVKGRGKRAFVPPDDPSHPRWTS